MVKVIVSKEPARRMPPPFSAEFLATTQRSTVRTIIVCVTSELDPAASPFGLVFRDRKAVSYGDRSASGGNPSTSAGIEISRCVIMGNFPAVQADRAAAGADPAAVAAPVSGDAAVGHGKGTACFKPYSSAVCNIWTSARTAVSTLVAGQVAAGQGQTALVHIHRAAAVSAAVAAVDHAAVRLQDSPSPVPGLQRCSLSSSQPLVVSLE